MRSYLYRAVHVSGRVHRGQLMASNEDELFHFLRDSGLELIEARVRRLPKLSVHWKRRHKGVSLKERALLCRQLADLLRAGLPFLQALQGILESQPPGSLRDKVDAMERSINRGSSVAAAFSRHPGLFNPVFLAILRAGEIGGDLTLTFRQLARYLQWQARLHDQLVRALRYPLFLLCLAFGVTAFMMITVVPRVMEFLTTLSGHLPFLTRVLIRLSRVFAEGWWIFLLALIGFGLAVFLARRHSERFALRSDRWLLALPGLGTTLHKLAIARFAHSFALLLQSGVDLPLALRTAQGVLGNKALEQAAMNAEERVMAGQTLSYATRELFPPFVTQMIRVGEQSGRLAETLDEVTGYYDAEAQGAVEQFIGALEPALTILVGSILAWVVLAVLGPIYGSLGQLNMVP
jgi:type IV pilus assembly protein PilC